MAHNYIFTPRLVNEVRTGFNGVHQATTFGISPAQIASQVGLVNLPPYPDGNAVPNFNIAGFQQTGGTGSSIARNNTFQLLDNLTWTKGAHSVKFGGDFRYLTGYYSNVFSSSRLGQYTYNGSFTSSVINGNPYIGNPFAAFLLGVPDKTQLASVIQPNAEAYARHYATYVQDDWKVTLHLTINYGLRWEYHPMFQDHLLNVTNFLPDFTSTVNGQVVKGVAVIPNQDSFKILNPLFAASIAPTPILTAAQAGIPESLRNSVKNDFAPRIGIAWRVNNKTVIRGGYRRFIEAPLGSLISAAWGVHTSYLAIFNNGLSGGKPALNFPYPFPSNLAQPGVQDFEQAGDVNYKDPWVHQWNFTFERDLGFGTALRVSYDGNHGSQLGVQENLDQVQPNTVGYNVAKLSAPFPLWAKVGSENNGGWSNYHAATVSLAKRFSKGMQYQGSYTFARNLSSGQSWNPTSFATEAGGLVTNRFDIGLDYGNVAFTRRQRFLSTFLYQLPFGRTVLKGNKMLNQAIGGWDLAGVVLFQTGPFLTATVPGADPSGTGFPTLIGNGRPDTVAGVSLVPATQTIANWVNKAAFAVPANNIGRFGYAPVGNMIGPGTQAISLSLMKSISFTENMKVQFGAQAANLFNHANYATPNTTFNTASFGTISNVQSAEGAGPRQIQLTARFTF